MALAQPVPAQVSLVQIPFHFRPEHLPMLIKNYRKVQTQRQQEAKISNFTTSYCGWIVKYLCSVNFYCRCPEVSRYCHFYCPPRYKLPLVPDIWSTYIETIMIYHGPGLVLALLNNKQPVCHKGCQRNRAGHSFVQAHAPASRMLSVLPSFRRQSQLNRKLIVEVLWPANLQIINLWLGKHK